MIPAAPKPRRWPRRLLIAMLVLAALPLVPVLFHRFVDPTHTAFMWVARAELKAAGREHRIMRNWTDIASISPNLRLAVVASEDQKFFEHRGFDVEAIQKAIAYNERSRDQQRKQVKGASTISQQVAKNLYLWPSRSLLRKGLEAYLTLLIEATWPKRRILEVYLNVAQFDADLFGAEAAAQRFFHKPASRLSRSEAALLAAVLPNPKRFRAAKPSGYVQRRQDFIEDQMRMLGNEHLGDLAR
jgi:monofunctional biosynthetic peptidoglycan transglycosylase